MRLLLAVVLLSVVGCTVTPPQDKVTNGLQSISSNVSSAKSELAKANAELEDIELPEVAKAKEHLFLADGFLTEAVKQIATVREYAVDAAGRVEKLKKQLTEERDHWLGYKSRRVIKWIVGLVVGYFALALVLRWVATLGGGWLFSGLRVVSAAMLNVPTLFSGVVARKIDERSKSYE